MQTKHLSGSLWQVAIENRGFSNPLKEYFIGEDIMEVLKMAQEDLANLNDGAEHMFFISSTSIPDFF